MSSAISTRLRTAESTIGRALNRKFRGHIARVINLIKFVVGNLDNPVKLKEQLFFLGSLHVKKGISLRSSGATLSRVLVQQIGRAYTGPEVEGGGRC
jgi:hypothetical protein